MVVSSYLEYRMSMNVSSTAPKVPEFISNKVIYGKYYILDPDAPTEQDLSIICAGKETCSEAYHIDRRKFEFFAIEFVASGSCELTLNGKKSELPAGSSVPTRSSAQQRASSQSVFDD